MKTWRHKAASTKRAVAAGLPRQRFFLGGVKTWRHKAASTTQLSWRRKLNELLGGRRRRALPGFWRVLCLRRRGRRNRFPLSPAKALPSGSAWTGSSSNAPIRRGSFLPRRACRRSGSSTACSRCCASNTCGGRPLGKGGPRRSIRWRLALDGADGHPAVTLGGFDRARPEQSGHRICGHRRSDEAERALRQNLGSKDGLQNASGASNWVRHAAADAPGRGVWANKSWR